MLLELSSHGSPGNPSAGRYRGVAYGGPMKHSLFGLPVASASVWIFNSYVIDAGDGLVVADPGLPIVAKKAAA